MRFCALFFAVLALAACSGATSASSAADFVGTWSCALDDAGHSLSFAVTASGNELTETFSAPLMGTGGSLMCTEHFTVSDSTATLISNLTGCTVPQGAHLEGTPAFVTQTVRGNVLTYTGADEGGPPSTFTCTRQ
jgi:hypothetical protein